MRCPDCGFLFTPDQYSSSMPLILALLRALRPGFAALAATDCRLAAVERQQSDVGHVSKGPLSADFSVSTGLARSLL
jgi:hypothetical protein